MKALVLLLAVASSICGQNFADAGKGQPAIVLIHGWTCDATFWRMQTGDLSKERRVIAIDLPGHGTSPMPEGGIGLTTFSDAIETALSKAKVARAVLVGHSMGGPVIRQYARLHPERVAGLVFVDAGFSMPNTPAMRAWAESFGGEKGMATRKEFIPAMMGKFASEEVRAEVARKMLAAPERTAVEAARWMVDPASMPASDRFSVPTLVITPKDRPVQKEAIQAMFANVRFEQIADTGHFLMMEKPKVFNAMVLEFVGKVK